MRASIDCPCCVSKFLHQWQLRTTLLPLRREATWRSFARSLVFHLQMFPGLITKVNWWKMVTYGGYRTSEGITPENTTAQQVTRVAKTAKEQLLMCNVSHCLSIKIHCKNSELQIVNCHAIVFSHFLFTRNIVIKKPNKLKLWNKQPYSCVVNSLII